MVTETEVPDLALNPLEPEINWEFRIVFRKIQYITETLFFVTQPY